MIKIDDKNFIDYSPAPWDGNPLSMKANEIVNFKADNEANANSLLEKFELKNYNINYTSCRFSTSDFHLKKSLYKFGYDFTEIVYGVVGVLSKLNIDETSFDKFNIEYSKINDIETIYNYAESFFYYGKFHEDPLISDLISKKRNINMVKDIFPKSKTLLAKINKQVIGFMIFSEKLSDVNLLLGGMHPNYVHLSYPFWNKILMELRSKKNKRVKTVISAANINVVNLYNSFGFKISNAMWGCRKFR
ncbi:MAG: hypothetical protein CBE49_003635 [Rickettsiales bacterium TMED289]|nr:MAG: hypothetical protein CBE49_003635 [Rickettsiales bacterium TMED289]|tara:strand:- start:896 stop:1636 length:741 start_codon:yes stop_codon:yes gene_type:complete